MQKLGNRLLAKRNFERLTLWRPRRPRPSESRRRSDGITTPGTPLEICECGAFSYSFGVVGVLRRPASNPAAGFVSAGGFCLENPRFTYIGQICPLAGQARADASPDTSPLNHGL